MRAQAYAIEAKLPASDRTGLTGSFEIRLDWALKLDASVPMTQDLEFQSAPWLPEALDQELGLRAETARSQRTSS
jgi:uncharacterized protein (TIGR03435 family)